MNCVGLLLRLLAFCTLVLGFLSSRALADDLSVPAPRGLPIRRITTPIQIDGVLDDAAWQTVVAVDAWYETRPGDNTPPKLKNRAYLAYDESALYIGFELTDPHPEELRASLGDRDSITSDMDYAGVILDPTNSGRTGIELYANPRGVQSDAVIDDVTGTEDASPDFFWDSAARITRGGWSLEIRVPYASLSYPRGSGWRIMLFRNYSRDFRYQFFSTPLPRGGSCFVCYTVPLLGLSGLPGGGGVVIAPYVSGTLEAVPRADSGSPLRGRPLQPAAGFDLKWRPDAGTVLDLTVNPDYSQVEADVAQIAANERFALFFPEKRPFFLEGAELFANTAGDGSSGTVSTPLQAVYTRTLSNPEWGVRGTAKVAGLAMTGLVVQDAGGGSVVLPGATSSDLAAQDFRSWAGIWRVRYGTERALVGAVATAREIYGGGYNFVTGGDFQWFASPSDRLQGQFLLSKTQTPDRPELALEWDGRELSGPAGELEWAHSTSTLDWTATLREVSSGFRAYNGFVPQVGFREGYAEAGYTLHPDQGVFRKIRGFARYDRSVQPDWDLLLERASVGATVEGLLSSQTSVRYAFDRVLAGADRLPQHQLFFDTEFTPSRFVSRVAITAAVGSQVDFENARQGFGADLTAGVSLRPTPHVEVGLDEGFRTLYVRPVSDAGDPPRTRLFTAVVHRLRATYSFTPRFFLRAITQYEDTRRAPELYAADVARKDGSLLVSLLLAYKFNWQSVLFLGYGDTRSYADRTSQLEPTGRQLFVKASYAFQ
jgi:Domain of unknown function (DUF5916)